MAIVPLYGVTIHQACGSGDIDEMYRVAAEAEEHLETYGNVPEAYEQLKAEIAKLEASG